MLGLLACNWKAVGIRTCISTFCPSPLDPSRIAVTTTNWSLATKFRTHRSYFAASCGETGWRSNLRAAARGRRTSSTQLKSLDNRSMVLKLCESRASSKASCPARNVQVSQMLMLAGARCSDRRARTDEGRRGDPCWGLSCCKRSAK